MAEMTASHCKMLVADARCRVAAACTVKLLTASLTACQSWSSDTAPGWAMSKAKARVFTIAEAALEI